jgi:hypothetical protein
MRSVPRHRTRWPAVAAADRRLRPLSKSVSASSRARGPIPARCGRPRPRSAASRTPRPADTAHPRRSLGRWSPPASPTSPSRCAPRCASSMTAPRSAVRCSAAASGIGRSMRWRRPPSKRAIVPCIAPSSKSARKSRALCRRAVRKCVSRFPLVSLPPTGYRTASTLVAGRAKNAFHRRRPMTWKTGRPVTTRRGRRHQPPQHDAVANATAISCPPDHGHVFAPRPAGCGLIVGRPWGAQQRGPP